MSTHRLEVVKLGTVEPHPNADRLEVVAIRGWQCVVGKGQFALGCLAAYVEPDSLVPVTQPEFAFLASKAVPTKYNGMVRVKVAKLRGAVSQGVLIPARPHWKEGDNVMEELGVLHYEPPQEAMNTGGESEKAPVQRIKIPGIENEVLHEYQRPVYDVESYYRYPHLLIRGEPVCATEKIHGSNARFFWSEGRMWCGSRTEWKKPNDANLWWRVLAAESWLEEFCREHPTMTVYGEAYGNVQDLSYGHKKGEVSLAVFDILDGNRWIPWREARIIGKNLKWVPILYEGPFYITTLGTLADGQSAVPGANNIREGIVVKPDTERVDIEIGRVQLKLVSNVYLERA